MFVCSAPKEQQSVKICILLSVFLCLKNKQLALLVLNVIYYMHDNYEGANAIIQIKSLINIKN